MIEVSINKGLAWVRHRGLLNFSGLCSLLFCVFLTVVCGSSTAWSFVLFNHKWPQPSTTFYVDIPGEDGLWNQAFEEALDAWGVDTSFTFLIERGVYEDPCDGWEGRNGVAYGQTYCGEAWGATTLGITQSWYDGNYNTIQADIVFNSNESWTVYSGPWNYQVNDFRRVAIHELGHALGLGHEDSGVASIMQSYAGDINIPQQDDINGVETLYGVPVVDSDNDGVADGSDNCPDVSNAGQEDGDSDGIGDLCDSCPDDQYNDADSDGVCGDIDVCPDDPLKTTSSGQCGCGEAETDTDSDGTADCLDGCINDPLKIVPGVCGCSVADTDTDNDGIEDCNDICPAGDDSLDSDGDDLPDACDQCPADSTKGEPGSCGCNVPEILTDADSDGTLDCVDEKDYDGDGFSDRQEVICGSDPAESGSRCSRSLLPIIMLLLGE